MCYVWAFKWYTFHLSLGTATLPNQRRLFLTIFLAEYLRLKEVWTFIPAASHSVTSCPGECWRSRTDATNQTHSTHQLHLETLSMKKNLCWYLCKAQLKLPSWREYGHSSYYNQGKTAASNFPIFLWQLSCIQSLQHLVESHTSLPPTLPLQSI